MEEGRDLGRMMVYGVRGSFRGALKPHPAPTGPPVLCIHGYTMNGSNFFGIRAELERRGRASRAIWLGLPGKRIQAYAPGVAHALREMIHAHGTIDVVAHSMGGIVLRVALRDNPELGPHIRRIVTLGTPHRGTAGARGPLGWLPEPADLHRRSPLLAALPDFRKLAPQAEVSTVGSPYDLVVYPPESTRLDGARHFDRPLSHIGLVVHPSMAGFVADLLGESAADA